MINRLFCAVLAAGALATAAHAQPAGLDCRVATLRISTVKPGKMPVMLKAVADQSAWYADHKIPSYSKVVRVLSTAAPGFAEDQIATVTVHGDPAAALSAQHDAAWNAFVAEFADASTIKEETRICLPDLSKP